MQPKDSANDRVEQLIESIRVRQAPIGIGVGNPATPITEPSKDQVEQLLASIRTSGTASDYGTVPFRIGARIPGTVTVDDARKQLFRGYSWNFSAGGRTLEKKENVTRRVKTSRNWDDLKKYPWSVGSETVKDPAAVPVGHETVDDVRILMRNGEYWGFSTSSGESSSAANTDPREQRTNISRDPEIFEGFAIGSVPQQRTYYPLLPVSHHGN